MVEFNVMLCGAVLRAVLSAGFVTCFGLALPLDIFMTCPVRKFTSFSLPAWIGYLLRVAFDGLITEGFNSPTSAGSKPISLATASGSLSGRS